jgi:hypothetical protein
MPRAHSFGRFKKHALLKAHTQSPCFSYPGLARAFISAGSADLLSFGGVSVGYGARFTVLVAGLLKSPMYMQLHDVLAMKTWFKLIFV